MNITYIFRKKTDHQHSIERVFNPIIDYLMAENEVNIHQVPFSSSSFYKIFRNISSVKKSSNEIYHITGDIHYMSLNLPKQNTVLTIHDIESVYKGKSIKDWIKKMIWFQLPFSKLRYVTVISEFTKNQLLEIVNFDSRRIRVIHNPVSPEIIFRPKENIEEIPVLLQIGTKENKNLHNLIDALEGINIKLVIIGKIPSSIIKSLKDKKINFENHINLSNDEMLSHYYKADILCFISKYEGFGMPVIEAQASGTPVLASNIDAIKEVARDSVYYVSPDDKNSIRNGILNLCKDSKLRQELIEKGKENSNRFSVNIISSQYDNLYKEMQTNSGQV